MQFVKDVYLVLVGSLRAVKVSLLFKGPGCEIIFNNYL